MRTTAQIINCTPTIIFACTLRLRRMDIIFGLHRQVEHLLQWLHSTIWRPPVCLNKEAGHLALPSSIYVAFGHLRASPVKVLGLKIATSKPSGRRKSE
jgi:hypothetical protein